MPLAHDYPLVDLFWATGFFLVIVLAYLGVVAYLVSQRRRTAKRRAETDDTPEGHAIKTEAAA